MIDNEKKETAFYNSGFDHHERGPFYGGYDHGYAARDKEAEEENREFLKFLVQEYTVAIMPPKQKLMSDRLRLIIEKHTGKSIDEVIK